MKKIKLYFTNKDNKVISKDIEENLVPIYLNIGWKKEQSNIINKVKIDKNEIRNRN